ncbi:MAG TPA: HAMP domain-containing sensor histidine kinase, partial [Candidatus Hydrogenedentes bacterium]|nr:HAMP domain-containing sensor histidine kinase [Candidatus Hydrogenedentota bacterium]
IITVLVVQGLLFALIALLMTYLMRLLRDGARQLRESNRELDRLSRQRRDFLHLALHNLRSPIGAVSMLLSNLGGGYAGPLNDQQAAWTDRAQHRLRELTAFLHDLESLALLESGDLESYMQDVNLPELLGAVVEENQDLARQHRHALTLELADGLRPVRGVPRLIREAVANFITNAVKYTLDGGRITVRAMNRGRFVRVEVEDNGVGIPPEAQTRLFQEFVRVHKTHAAVAKVPGSGLGLVIVRRIAEAHGGRINVRSHVDRGSIFGFEVPAAD